jgi:gliding motility-associated-like protein
MLGVSKAPGSLFNIGITTVVYTATDAAGNAATCSFTVTVNDVTPPFILEHADIVETAGPSCTAKVNFSPPTSEDCGPVVVTSSHQPGHEFPVGITEVLYTATDIVGNQSTNKFNVIVEDQSVPVFQNCVTDIIVNANSTCSAVVNWALPSVTDNCGGVTISSSHNPGETFPLGITPVSYTAIDNKGNVSTCVFNVIVKNETAPTISNCPRDISLTGNEAGIATAEWTEPTASTPCGAVTMIRSHDPGDFFYVGTTKIEYQATADEGNTSYCYFNVIVSQMDIEIDVGKVVTPDGNGINDAWVLNNIEKFPNNKVVIVDRWGGLIFNGTGYDNENVVWRGTNRSGHLVPTGTYFYTVSVRFGSDKVEKSGFIELVR